MSGLLILLLQLASLLFIARAILSWFRIGPDSSLYPIADGIHRLTEPVVAPIRRVIPPLGGLDLSVLIVILGINVILVPIVRNF